MTAYRSTAEFVTALSGDYAWRLKEIIDDKASVDRAKGPDRQRHLRSSAVMLYAHWEGHIKFASSHYLRYVADAIALRKLTAAKISSRVLALGLWDVGIGYNEASITQFVSEVGAALPSFHGPVPQITLSSIIDMESNLSSKVFKRVVQLVGLDYTKFELRERFIDEQLCRVRHKIAHGEALGVKMEDYLPLKDGVVELISIFRNEIENLVTVDAFVVA